MRAVQGMRPPTVARIVEERVDDDGTGEDIGWMKIIILSLKGGVGGGGTGYDERNRERGGRREFGMVGRRGSKRWMGCVKSYSSPSPDAVKNRCGSEE